MPDIPLEPPADARLRRAESGGESGFEPAVRFPVHTLSKRAP